MKLNYRGVGYEYNPPTVETTETGVAGKYRGLDWRFHNAKKPPVLQSPVNLTYRGVTYNNQPTAAQSPAAKVSQQSRWLMLKNQRANENRAASMLIRSAQALHLI